MDLQEDTRGLKARYRELIDEVHENEDDMIRPNSDALVNVLRRGNTLMEEVVTASAGTTDSMFMTTIAQMGKKKIQELKTDSNHFSANEFADRLMEYTLQGDAGPLKAEHWGRLGNAVQNFFKRPPTTSFLLGSFAKEPVQKKEFVRRQRVKDDNSKDKRTTIKKVEDDEAEQLESTAHDVTKRVLPELLKLYKHNNKEPICYYEFVIDPDSFGVTVENMFHVSFLIRDGLAEIKLDEDELPVILPTPFGTSGTLEGRDKEVQNLPRKQAINNIDMGLWREMKETYKIEKARIPRRKAP